MSNQFHINNKRLLKRHKIVDNHHYFEVETSTSAPPLKGKVLNFNSLSMLVKFDEDISLHEKSEFKNARIFFRSQKVGFYSHLSLVRYCQESKAYVFSLSLSSWDKQERRKNRRYQLNQNFPITTSFSLSTHYEYKVHGKALDISMYGALIEISLSNGRLTQGLSLKNVSFDFQGDIVSCDALIASIYLNNTKDKFILNLKFDTYSKELEKALLDYIYKFYKSPDTEQDPISFLKREKLLTKSIKDKLQFGFVNDPFDYHDVLALRESSYGPHYPDLKKSEKGFGDIYDENSRIITVKLKNKIVGSARLTFSQKDSDHFELEESIKLPSFIERNRTLEISRLCITPELQRSDLVIGLFERILIEAIQMDGEYIITSATDRLLKRYFKLGFQKGFDFNIATLSGVPHTFIFLKISEFYKGKNVHPYAWTSVYKKPLTYLHQLGFGKPQFPLIKRMLGQVIKFIFDYKIKKD